MWRSMILLSVLLSVGSIRHAEGPRTEPKSRGIRLLAVLGRLFGGVVGVVGVVGVLGSVVGVVGSIGESSCAAMRLPVRRNRMLPIQQRLGNRAEIGNKICFELLGCFTDRQQPLALKRPPQHPSIIETQFYLYTRENRKSPEVLRYGDKLQSMNQSHFNSSRSLKVIIHGFKGSGNNGEAVAGAQAFLDLEDANVIIVDWAKGAGTSYSLAVSNTELVGRQLGLILLDAVTVGVEASSIHLVGFSLGAHVAGCASEVLKKQDFLPGRITGLDPASPFFRRHLFREKARKLDASDARLVDVIHTDGSIDFIDGFGLLKPIGHIDFFPNGGRQQPGCNDVKNSVVVSHLNEDNLDIHIACSHTRSWFLFVESLRSQFGKCRFQSWPCKRRFGSFNSGSCFPPEDIIAAPEMGYKANDGPTGLYYLPTRADSPFCGYPLRAAVRIVENDLRQRGVLWMRMGTGNSSVTFSLISDYAVLSTLSSLNNRNSLQPTIFDIKAAEFESFNNSISEIEVSVKFEATDSEDSPESEYRQILLVEKISIEDRKGNRWVLCNDELSIGAQEKNLILKNEEC